MFLLPSLSETWVTVAMHLKTFINQRVAYACCMSACEDKKINKCALRKTYVKPFMVIKTVLKIFYRKALFINSYSKSLMFTAALKDLIWVWKVKWDQKWDKSFVFMDITWRQECDFQRNPIYISLEQMTWLNIYLHNCSQMLAIESRYKKVVC